MRQQRHLHRHQRKGTCLTILDVAKARKRHGLGVLHVQMVEGRVTDDNGVQRAQKIGNKACKRRATPDMDVDYERTFAQAYRRNRMATLLAVDEDVKSRCKQLWERLQPMFRGLAHAHIDGSVHPTYKELSKFQDITTYLQTRMRKTGGRPSAWNVFILRTVVMQDLSLKADECSYAMVAAAAWESGLCDKDAWRASRNVKTMFLCADRVPSGYQIGNEHELCRTVQSPEEEAPTDALAWTPAAKAACADLWARLRPVFCTLSHAHIDGSVHPTYKELQAYQVISAFITTRMRKTDRPSSWSAFILRMVVMQDLALQVDECSPAMVVAAVWEAGFCDRDAWRSAKNVKAMFVYAEFYGDESKYSHAWPSPWLAKTVPVRFKHRLAAAASMICNATGNGNLVYVCSGMDFLLPLTYLYYTGLKDALCSGHDDALRSVSVQQWCRDTGFFEDGRLERALALDRDDGFQLQDVGFVKRRDAGERQYLWLPVVAYYIADMETRSSRGGCKSGSSLCLTPLVDMLKIAPDWSGLSLRCRH